LITEIFIAYSWWTILLIIALALLYAGLLYVKNPLNKLSRLLIVILFVFRFLAVFILGFLLLSPTIKTKKKQIEKPIILLGQDNSKSVIMTKDSIYYTDTITADISKLITELSIKNDVESFLFGDTIQKGITPDYKDNTSNYSDFFSYLKQNYIGLNVGAIIITGDGIINNGIDPVYAASDINFPIFTIAYGNTSQTKDAKIDDVRYNSIAYSGDIFPIEVSLSANKMKGEKTSLSLVENNKIIAKKTINFSNDNFRKTVIFNIEAKKAGKHRYKLILNQVSNEISNDNNIQNIFIDILDSKQSILILAYAPHPDIGSIKQSLVMNKNYTVEIDYINSFNGDITKYNLIILHQLPAKRNSAVKLLKKILEKKIPTLYILGNQSNLTVFNKYFKGMNILTAVGSTVPAQFVYNNSFSFFTINNKSATQLSTLPPLNVPLGNYKLSAGSDVFGWQLINSILTDFPLITYYNDMGVKSGVISGEGLWLWRMHSNLQYGNSDAMDVLLNKAAMFLIADIDKRHFKIHTKGEYNSNLDIIIDAELYNQALELENSTDVTLILTNEIGEKYNFVFSPYDDYYKLNLNKLPIGIYSYKATVKLGADSYTDIGEFIVQRLNNESKNLNANHRILNQLAIDHDGSMYYPNEIDKLLIDINNLESMKSKIHYEDKFTGLNSLIYILIGIILLLSIEWFIRKYFGNY